MKGNNCFIHKFKKIQKTPTVNTKCTKTCKKKKKKKKRKIPDKQHDINIHNILFFDNFPIVYLSWLTAIVIYIKNIELWPCEIFLNQQTKRYKNRFCSHAQTDFEVTLNPRENMKIKLHCTPADILSQHVQLKGGLLFSYIWCGYLCFQTKCLSPHYKILDWLDSSW